jgi:hypothetical protein
VRSLATPKSTPAAEYRAMALRWMKGTLRCALEAESEGCRLVLSGWKLLDCLEVRVEGCSDLLWVYALSLFIVPTIYNLPSRLYIVGIPETTPSPALDDRRQGATSL